MNSAVQKNGSYGGRVRVHQNKIVLHFFNGEYVVLPLGAEYLLQILSEPNTSPKLKKIWSSDHYTIWIDTYPIIVQLGKEDKAVEFIPNNHIEGAKGAMVVSWLDLINVATAATNSTQSLL